MEPIEKYLRENYLCKTKKTMAKELGMTYNQVDHQLRLLNLYKYHSADWNSEELEILKEYYPKSSKNIICSLLPNHRWSAIQKQASKYGIHREWSYLYISVQGYLIDCSDRNHKVEVHRKLYEQYHNVKLTSDDIIHHKDGNKLNNSKDNLVLMDRSEHINLHRPLYKNYHK